MKRKTRVKAASSICPSCSRSLRSAPCDSRYSPRPRAILGNASLMSRSSKPLRNSSPKSFASPIHPGQPTAFPERFRGKKS